MHAYNFILFTYLLKENNRILIKHKHKHFNIIMSIYFMFIYICLICWITNEQTIPFDTMCIEDKCEVKVKGYPTIAVVKTITEKI